MANLYLTDSFDHATTTFYNTVAGTPAFSTQVANTHSARSLSLDPLESVAHQFNQFGRSNPAGAVMVGFKARFNGITGFTSNDEIFYLGGGAFTIADSLIFLERDFGGEINFVDSGGTRHLVINSTTNTWYSIEIMMYAGRCRVWVDDVLELDVSSLPTPGTPSNFRFSCDSLGSPYRFDDFYILENVNDSSPDDDRLKDWQFVQFNAGTSGDPATTFGTITSGNWYDTSGENISSMVTLASGQPQNAGFYTDQADTDPDNGGGLSGRDDLGPDYSLVDASVEFVASRGNGNSNGTVKRLDRGKHDGTTPTLDSGWDLAGQLSNSAIGHYFPWGDKSVAGDLLPSDTEYFCVEAHQDSSQDFEIRLVKIVGVYKKTGTLVETVGSTNKAHETYQDGSVQLTDDNAKWTDEANAVDGLDTTYAVGTAATTSEYNYFRTEGLANPLPTTTARITSVEIRYKGYIHKPAQAVAGRAYIVGYLRVDGENLTPSPAILTTTTTAEQTVGPEWDEWDTISPPTGGWTKAKVEALEVRNTPRLESGTDVTITARVYKIEIRVNYESFPHAVVSGVGEDGAAVTVVEGQGDADGAATVAGDSGATQQGEGNADGAATVAGDAAGVGAAEGNADGAATVAGDAAEIHAAEGNADGVATVAGEAAEVDASQGDGDGAASVSGDAGATQSVEGDADGVASVGGDASGVGAADGDADGTATVAGEAAEIHAAEGAADGVASVAGEASEIHAGEGSSSGSATVAGVGEATQGGAFGDADGQATVAGEASEIHAAEGSAGGSASVSGESSSPVEGQGDADGAATVAGGGAGVREAEGSAAGVASVSGEASEIHAADGDSDGVATVDGEAIEVHAGEGAAAGAGSVSGEASEIHAADGDSDGAATVAGEGAGVLETEGNADGAATVAGDSEQLDASTGDADGSASVSGEAIEIHAAEGSAGGAASVSGEGAAVRESEGNADGAATVAGDAQGTLETEGAADGVATVSGDGEQLGAGEGAADGGAAVSGDAEQLGAGEGAADGTGAVDGDSGAIQAAEGSSDGQATVAGEPQLITDTQGDADGGATVAGEGVGIGAAEGQAGGSATVAGVSAATQQAEGNADGQATVAGRALPADIDDILYPTILIENESVLAPSADIKMDSADDGTKRGRVRIAPTVFYGRIVHAFVSTADKDSVLSHYDTNRDTLFALEYGTDYYYMRYSARPVTRQMAGERWAIESQMAGTRI